MPLYLDSPIAAHASDIYRAYPGYYDEETHKYDPERMHWSYEGQGSQPQTHKPPEVTAMHYSERLGNVRPDAPKDP